MLLMGIATAQAMAVEAVEPQFGHRRPVRRRFGRGRDRPLNADEPVTPPPQLEVPWPVRSTRPDLTRPARITGPTTLQSLSRMARDEAASADMPAEKASDVPANPADEYEAAMARWRAVRAVGLDDAAASGEDIPSARPDPAARASEPAADDAPQDREDPRSAKIVKLPPRPSRS
jgi:hypothetical protein